MARRRSKAQDEGDLDIGGDEGDLDDEDGQPEFMEAVSTLEKLYAPFRFDEGYYYAVPYRSSPALGPDGTPTRGFLPKFNRPLFIDDLERIFGGGKYQIRVEGPRDPINPERGSGWLAASKSVGVAGVPKTPPDFSGERDRPVGYTDKQLAAIDTERRAKLGLPPKEALEEGDGEGAALGKPSSASIAASLAAGGVNESLISFLMTTVEEAKVREAAMVRELRESSRHDPTADVRAEIGRMQQESWDRLMQSQQTQSERFADLLSALAGKGNDGAGAQLYLTTIESMKGSMEAMQREHQKALVDLQRDMASAVERAEERHRADRQFMQGQYESREKDLRDRFSHDLDEERRRAEDATKYADRKASELRSELRDARTRIDALQDQLSEARMQAAAGTGSKNPLKDLQHTAEAFQTMKGIFGGGSGNDGDVVSRIFDAVESGAVERTVGGIGAQVASALNRNKPAAPNPQTAGADNATWQQYVQAQEEARAASRAQAQARTGVRRRRVRGAAQAPAMQGQQQPQTPAAQAQQAAVAHAQQVAQAAAQALPPEFAKVDGRDAGLADLPLLIERAVEGNVPPQTFATFLRPAIGGAAEEVQLLALDDATALSLLESQIQTRLPGRSRQYIREVLGAFRLMLASPPRPPPQPPAREPEPAADDLKEELGAMDASEEIAAQEPAEPPPQPPPQQTGGPV